MSDLRNSIEHHAQFLREGYLGPEVSVYGYRLPADYWDLARLSDGFATTRGMFRFLSVGGRGGMLDRNSSSWTEAYGDLLRGFVHVAEDVFGDLYGYVFVDGGPGVLSKFFCEGGGIEPCTPSLLSEFLSSEVLTDQPGAFDALLAQEAWSVGLRPALTEHLAFSVPLIVGGEYGVKNLSVEPLALHLGVLAQLTKRVRELPEGTPIGGFRDR